MDSNKLANADQLKEKWSPVLDHNSLQPIEDNYRKSVTAILLENQEQAIREANGSVNETTNAAGAGIMHTGGNSNMQGFDPILISLVRRSMPNLMAYDVCGVQPMTGPTGLIFALKSKMSGQGGDEALFNEANTRFSGTDTAGSTAGPLGGGDPLFGDSGVSGEAAGALDYDYANGGMSTANAEGLGGSNHFNEMAFSITRTSVEAKTRALKAEYTTELAQDLKAVHGLDAESELANILSNEILAEINREIIRTIYGGAVLGCQHEDLRARQSGVSGGISAEATGGVYDVQLDADGRWSAERWRGLLYQLEREANLIAKQTRRGKGNFVICSADVASALAMSGFLTISPAQATNLNVDDTGNTFAGTLNGKMKVYIDPYSGPGIGAAAKNYACVGYKGTSPYDAGMFYCPYVPLQMVRAVGENTFQPKIGFKTRYGIVNNPFVATADPHAAAARRKNQYYRIFRIDNLHGLGS
jgi:hypothetical protein